MAMVLPTLAGLLLQALPAASTSQASSASMWQTAQDTDDRLTKKADVDFEPDFEFDGPTVGIAGRRQQKIVGFGSAFTEAAASTFASLPIEKQEKLLQDLYGPDGIGFTVGRVHINSCDFSIDHYDFDGTDGDVDLKDFDNEVTHDKQWLLPLIVRAQEVLKSRGAELNLLASPWSPPAWMKQSGQMDGSDDTCLKDGLRPTWAKYISKWISAYKKQGVNIWAITVQNEPGFAAPWEACKWSKEEEADFLGENLGPTLEEDHPEVKIFFYDHNKDVSFEWAETMYGHPTASKYAYGIALHWYSGDDFLNVQKIHDKFPDAVIMGSEATFEKGAWSHGDTMMTEGKWSFGEGYAHDIIGDIKAGASGWIDWNMMLDKDGGPNHLNNVCDAAVISDGDDYYLHPQYYYMGHFSKWVVPDSEYVETYVLNSDHYDGEGRGYGTCTGEDGLQAASFMRPDDQVALVVLNCGDDEVEFKIHAGEQAARSKIPAHAIQTYLIQRAEDVPATPALEHHKAAHAGGSIKKISANAANAKYTTRTGTTTTTTKNGSAKAAKKSAKSPDCEYFNSADGEGECPPGAEMVTKAECKEAGELNDPFTDDSEDDPAGCFMYLNRYYWNTGSGAGRAERKVHCKRCRKPDESLWRLFSDSEGPIDTVADRSPPAPTTTSPAALAAVSAAAGAALCFALVSLAGSLRRRVVTAARRDTAPSAPLQPGAQQSYAPLV